MKLGNKKELAANTFDVGKDRVKFVKARMEEIKDALTKQDMKDLKNDGAILIKEKGGRRKNTGGRRRSIGNVRKKVKKRKREYVTLTRKLRRYVQELYMQEKLDKEQRKEIRKKIRNRDFKSLAQLKRYINSLEK